MAVSALCILPGLSRRFIPFPPIFSFVFNTSLWGFRSGSKRWMDPTPAGARRRRRRDRERRGRSKLRIFDLVPCFCFNFRGGS